MVGELCNFCGAEKISGVVCQCGRSSSNIKESLPTDIQQLKAEIAALAEYVESCNRGVDFLSYDSIAKKLRQLSAV